MKHLLRIAAWLSQGLNIFFLWPFGLDRSHHDLTVSARAYVESKLNPDSYWPWVQLLIDNLFFWDKDHCESSFERDIQFAFDVRKWNAHP